MNTCTYRCAALATLSLLPMLAARPACAQKALTPSVIATDIAYTEVVARRPLSAAERQQVIAINQAQYQREPAWELQDIRAEVKTLLAVRRMDPVHLAAWRKACLVSNYFSTDAHVTPEENRTFLAIYTRTNPIIFADPATHTITTQRDVDAWAAATRLVARQSGVPTGDPYTSVLRSVRDPNLSQRLRLQSANMERNWIAYQLCWGHEPAGDRRRVAAIVSRDIRRAAPLGQALEMASGMVLALCNRSYSDYPAALSPQFALFKQTQQMQGMQMLMNTFHRGQENMRQQSRDDYDRENYEAAVRRR